MGHRKVLRPTLWPTLIAIPMLVALLGLGTWQVERLYEKRAMIAERQARTAAEPVAFPAPGDVLSAEQRVALEFRKSAVAGEFLHDREIYLAARSLNGNAGYHVITPVAVEGGFVLVDRGWVPVGRKDPAERGAGQVGGLVTIAGVIRLPATQHWLQPDNDAGKNVWFWLDLPAMAGYAGVNDRVAPVFLEADAAENPGGFPIGGQTRISLPNDHLQYAITWYSLAVALAVIYVLYHRRPAGP